MYVVNIIRYGDEKLGKYFFGIYTTKELAIKEAREYNSYRGGKYPSIEIYPVPIDKAVPFEEKKEIINLTQIA